MRRIEVIVKFKEKSRGGGLVEGVRVDVYEELKLFGKCKRKVEGVRWGVGRGGEGWLVARLG